MNVRHAGIAVTVVSSVALVAGAVANLQHVAPPVISTANYVKSKALSYAINLGAQAERIERAQQDPVYRTAWFCTQGNATQCVSTLPATFKVIPYRAMGMIQNADAWVWWVLQMLRRLG